MDGHYIWKHEARWVSNLVQLVEIMTNQIVRWAYLQTFGELKSKLSLPPMLKFGEFDKPFEMDMGVSGFFIGGFLMQDG